MNTKHTPGPWSVNRKLDTFVNAGQDGDGLTLICECDPAGEMKREEAVANAKLIASAPALLAALENIRADCERAMETRNVADMDFACAHAIEYCTAAIAAAR